MNHLVQRFYKDSRSNSNQAVRESPSPLEYNGHDYFAIEKSPVDISDQQEIKHDDLKITLKEISELIANIKQSIVGPPKVESKDLVFTVSTEHSFKASSTQIFPRSYHDFLRDKQNITKDAQRSLDKHHLPVNSNSWMQQINAKVSNSFSDNKQNDNALHSVYESFKTLKAQLTSCNDKLIRLRLLIVARIKELNSKENEIRAEETELQEQLEEIKALESELLALKIHVDENWESLDVIDKKLDISIEQKAKVLSENMKRNKARIRYVVFFSLSTMFVWLLLSGKLRWCIVNLLACTLRLK